MVRAMICAAGKSGVKATGTSATGMVWIVIVTWSLLQTGACVGAQSISDLGVSSHGHK